MNSSETTTEESTINLSLKATAACEKRASYVQKEKMNKRLNVALYTGKNIESLPELNSSLVKIVLCSNTDFALERNYLYRNVIPRLRKELIERFGFDITLVELRWSMKDDATNDKRLLRACLSELKRTQNESIGINFIGMLSNRFGSRFLVDEIPKEEFELENQDCMMSVTLAYFYSSLDPGIKTNSDLNNLKRSFYELDDNDIDDKKYKLNSDEVIIKKLKNEGYNMNGDKDFLRKKKKELAEEMRKYYQMQNVTKEAKMKYCESVIESELNELLFSQKSDNTVFFIRKINGLASGETKWSDANSEPVERLKKRVEDFYKKNTNNLIKLEVSKEGLETGAKDYLDKLETALTSRILKSAQAAKQNQIHFSDDDKEIIHYWYIYNNLIKNYEERDEHSHQINKFLNSNECNGLFIYGPSGIGKSSTVANIVKKAMDKDMVVIQRYLGTSKRSSSARSVLQSIIYQQTQISNKAVPFYDDGIADYSITDLKEHVITNFERISELKTIVLIDGLDELSDDEFDLHFIFTRLPKNVKIVYSALSRRNNLDNEFDRINSMLSGEYTSMHLQPLDKETSAFLLKKWLVAKHRELSKKQWERIDNLLNQICKSDKGVIQLHLRLIFDIAVKWRSSFQPSDQFIKDCLTLNGTVRFIFKELERSHGKVFLSHFMFYMNVFKFGISEKEIEDLMSIDDEVLSEVSDDVELVAGRFPMSLWMRLRNDLNAYLSEREAGGTLVLSWQHRCFSHAAQEYLMEVFGESVSKKDEILMNILNYFTEKCNTDEKNSKKFELALKREMKTQQMIFHSAQGCIQGFNERKLTHFISIVKQISCAQQQIGQFLEHVFFDYEFMLAQTLYQNKNFFLDLHDYITLELTANKCDTNAKLLRNISLIFTERFKQFQSYPDTIIIELLSRLPRDKKLVQKLESDHKAFEKRANKECALIPTHNFLEISDKSQVLYTSDYSEVKHVWLSPNSPYILIAFEVYLSLQVVMVNHEQLRTLEGRMVMHLNCDYMCMRPFFSRNPENSCLKRLNQFDGGIIYKETKNLKSFINKKSFKSNRVICLREFDEAVIDIFLVGKEKLVVCFQSAIELINHNTRETLAVFETAYSTDSGEAAIFNEIKSNKHLCGVIYSSDFEQAPTLIFCFCRILDDRLVFNSVEPVKIDDDIYVYELTSYHNKLDFHANRLYSIEHASMNGDYSLVKGQSEDLILFQFAFYGQFGEDIHICSINKKDFFIKESILEICDNQSFYELKDFYMNKILVKHYDDMLLRAYDCDSFDCKTIEDCVENFDKGFLLNNDGNCLIYELHNRESFEINTLSKTFLLKKNYIINFEEYQVFKQFPESLNKDNDEKSEFKITNLFGFMDDNHFVAEIIAKKQRNNAIINVNTGSIKYKFESIWAKFVSKHFIVSADIVHFIKDLNGELSIAKQQIPNKSKIFIADHASKYFLYAYHDGVDLEKFERDGGKCDLRFTMQQFASITIRKLWIDERDGELKIEDIAQIELDRSMFPSRVFDYVIVNQRYLVIMSEKAIKCHDFKGLSETKVMSAALLFNYRHLSGEMVRLIPLERQNKLICVGGYEGYFIELSPVLNAVKKEFKFDKKLEIKGSYLAYITDYKSFIVYDTESDRELVRLNTGLVVEHIFIKPDLRYVITVHLNEIHIYSLRDVRLVLVLPIEYIFCKNNIILNENSLVFSSSKSTRFMKMHLQNSEIFLTFN